MYDKNTNSVIIYARRTINRYWSGFFLSRYNRRVRRTHFHIESFKFGEENYIRFRLLSYEIFLRNIPPVLLLYLGILSPSTARIAKCVYKTVHRLCIKVVWSRISSSAFLLSSFIYRIFGQRVVRRRRKQRFARRNIGVEVGSWGGRRVLINSRVPLSGGLLRFRF